MKKHTNKILIGLIVLTVLLFAGYSWFAQKQQAEFAQMEKERIQQQNEQVANNDQAIINQMNQFMQEMPNNQNRPPSAP